MIRFPFHIVLTFVLSLLFCVHLPAQNRKKLEAQNERLKKEIQKLNRQLSKVRSESNNTLTKIQLLDQKVKARQRLISNFEKEVSKLSQNILLSNNSIRKIKVELDTLQKQYASNILLFYKQQFKKQSFWTKLLFTQDLLAFYKANKYLEYSSRYRKNLLEKLTAKKLKLISETTALKSKQSRKKRSLKQKVKETDKLTSERKQKNRYIKRLRKKQGKLKKTLTKKQKDRKKLESQISKLIQQEILKARKNLALSKKIQKINRKFEKLKKKLVPPVKGPIVSKFGVHSHPVVKSVKINNNGVDITTNGKEKVKVIYDGKITSVFLTGGSKRTSVIVKHGSYFSVYSNLTKVKVKKDQVVLKGASLGKVQKNYDGQYLFQFQLWKDQEKLNPEKWLKFK